MFSDADPHAGSGAQHSATITNDHPIDRMLLASPVAPAAAKADNMDSPKVKRFGNDMLGHFLRELDIQGPNRILMAEDEAYYDHEQWKPEDADVVRARGQEPLVYNVIATTVNWILGTERRTRADYKILPRREAGAKGAEKKTQLLKYLADVNRTPYAVSRSFAQCAKAGLGWIESGLQEEDEGEPIYDRHESWRNILHDSAATELDLEDGRYQFRAKWADTDIAKQFFPERAAIIDLAADTSFEFGGTLDRFGDQAMDSHEELSAFSTGDDVEISAQFRQRVRLIECWFKVPQMAKRIKGGDFSGEIFDTKSEGHMTDIMVGRATIRQSVSMRTYVMVMTTAGVLWISESPYRHNKFPFTPLWCYRRAADNLPYGFIRGLKGMQDDINKRASKALAILSSNKTIMDKGAVDDLDELEEELARPNSIIVKRPGKDFKIDADRELAGAHIEMMGRTIDLIQQVSGVTDEAMGRTTNATSGVAIEARQAQGQLGTALVFDNLRLARQMHGEKMLSLCEQFMTEEREFRITNNRGEPDYVTINDGDPENDIIRTKADYIITDEDWNATLRQAQFSELMELITQIAPSAPEIALAVLDLVIDSSDISNREEIVKRIRRISGQEDPDVKDDPNDPEVQAREKSKIEEAEMRKRMTDAEISSKEAEAAEKAAKAAKAGMEVDQGRALEADHALDTQEKALELANKMLASRHALKTADALLAEVGFDLGPTPPMPMHPAAPAPPPTPQAIGVM